MNKKMAKRKKSSPRNSQKAPASYEKPTIILAGNYPQFLEHTRGKAGKFIFGDSPEKLMGIQASDGETMSADEKTGTVAAIQWDGSVQSADEVYKFIGHTFRAIWAYQTLVDGQPQYDPLYGGPVLPIEGSLGTVWMSPGDWIVKGEGEFFIVRESAYRVPTWQQKKIDYFKMWHGINTSEGLTDEP